MEMVLKSLSRSLYRFAENRELRRNASPVRANMLRRLIWALALVGGFLWLTWAAWDVHPVAGKAMAGICTLLIAGQALRSTEAPTDRREYPVDPLLRRAKD